MPFSPDTRPEARKLVAEALRQLPPQERVARCFEMSRLLAEVTRAGVERDLPAATELERHHEFLRRWLGRELAEKVIAHCWPEGAASRRTRGAA